MAHDKIHPSTTRFVWERLASYRLLGEDHYHLIDDSNYEQLLILDTPFHLHRTGDTTVPFDQCDAEHDADHVWTRPCDGRHERIRAGRRALQHVLIAR